MLLIGTENPGVPISLRTEVEGTTPVEQQQKHLFYCNSPQHQLQPNVLPFYYLFTVRNLSCFKSMGGLLVLNYKQNESYDTTVHKYILKKKIVGFNDHNEV